VIKKNIATSELIPLVWMLVFRARDYNLPC